MRNSLLIAIVLSALVVGVQAQPSQQTTIDLSWVHTVGIVVHDSDVATMDAGGVDTSDYVRVPDSSAQGGGVQLLIYSNEDTCKSGVKIEWGYYDVNQEKILPLPTVVVLDTLVANIMGVTSRNPMGARLNYRKPAGAEYVRVIVTAGTTQGAWQPDKDGIKAVPWLDGKITYAKF
jgi:hypothetical protein